MVAPKCLAVYCNADSRKFKRLEKYPCIPGITFHSFPKDLHEKRIWYNIRRKNGVNISNHILIMVSNAIKKIYSS